jgi:hypothetical protein
MDKQLVFFLMLAFLFLLKGVVSMNIIMQLSGIALLLFLIYDYSLNRELDKRYEKIYTTKFNFIGIFGYIDLVLGTLLIMWGLWGIIPLVLLFFLAILLLLKALPFVFGGDIASLLDILSAVVIFSLTVINVPLFILVAVSIYLIQKGVLSFFS